MYRVLDVIDGEMAKVVAEAETREEAHEKKRLYMKICGAWSHDLRVVEIKEEK